MSTVSSINPHSFTVKTGDTTKTYTLLSSLPRETTKIVKCGALLENRMQCWRAGDYQVIESTPTAPVEEGGEPGVKESVYQLCRRHTIEQEAADRRAVAATVPVLEAPEVPTAPTPADAPITPPEGGTPQNDNTK